MSENWGFYYKNLNEMISYVRVDLGLKENVPMQDYKYSITLMLSMKPKVFNIKRKFDYKLMTEIEDDLLKEFSNESAIIFVGTITNSEMKSLFFYSKDNDTAITMLDNLVSLHREVSYKITEDDDSNWELYKEFLYPNDLEMQMVKDGVVFESLRKHGDNLSSPREIRHWAYFKTNDDREKFSDIITKEGFTVANKSEVEGQEFMYGIQFCRINNADFNSIIDVTVTLFNAAKDCNGEYDGWESPVIK